MPKHKHHIKKRKSTKTKNDKIKQKAQDKITNLMRIKIAHSNLQHITKIYRQNVDMVQTQDIREDKEIQIDKTIME